MVVYSSPRVNWISTCLQHLQKNTAVFPLTGRACLSRSSPIPRPLFGLRYDYSLSSRKLYNFGSRRRPRQLPRHEKQSWRQTTERFRRFEVEPLPLRYDSSSRMDGVDGTTRKVLYAGCTSCIVVSWKCFLFKTRVPVEDFAAIASVDDFFQWHLFSFL